VGSSPAHNPAPCEPSKRTGPSPNSSQPRCWRLHSHRWDRLSSHHRPNVEHDSTTSQEGDEIVTTTDGPAPTPVQGADLKQPSDTGTPNRVFSALQREWTTVGSDASARRATRKWVTAAPALVGFASPAEVVATIARPGDPARSCALLAELLVIADTDELAARAVLQAILPGLHHAARRRWQPTTAGPWTHADDVAADAVSAGWAAIRDHAGQRCERPAAIIIRTVEGRLRRAHDTWRRRAAPTLPPGEPEPSQSALDAALTIEEQAMELVADAVRAGVVSSAEAELLLATGVLGYTLREVGRLTAADGNAAYRRLHLARASLKAWVEDRSDLAPSGSEATRRYASQGTALFPALAFSERAIAASDRREDAAVGHAARRSQAARHQSLQGLRPYEGGRHRLGDHRHLPQDPPRRPDRLRRTSPAPRPGPACLVVEPSTQEGQDPGTAFRTFLEVLGDRPPATGPGLGRPRRHAADKLTTKE
jgi:DNA-directed RNA polymerase specialized sigma24 family protein